MLAILTIVAAAFLAFANGATDVSRGVATLVAAALAASAAWLMAV